MNKENNKRTLQEFLEEQHSLKDAMLSDMTKVIQCR